MQCQDSHQQSPTKYNHPSLITEGSLKSSVITALLLNILVLPLAKVHVDILRLVNILQVTSDLVLSCHHSSPEQPLICLHQTAGCIQNKVAICY